MTFADRFLHEHATHLRRLVNESHTRRENTTVFVSGEALARIGAMAKAWKMTRSGVAGELLEAAAAEVWLAFEETREEGAG